MSNQIKTKEGISTERKLATYSDFFDRNGMYKLRGTVRNAYNKPSGERSAFDQEIITLDEKVNIYKLIFSSGFMKIFPVAQDKNNRWESPLDGGHQNQVAPGGIYSRQFYQEYIAILDNAIRYNDWSQANFKLYELGEYQKEFGREVMPSKIKIKAELAANRVDVFYGLGLAYLILGVMTLFLLWSANFKPSISLKRPSQIMLTSSLVLIVLYTLWLSLWWFAFRKWPWDNGYASVIFLGFAIALTGEIVGIKTLRRLAISNILVANLLIVSRLRWLDPDVLPLVTVAKPTWLTIQSAMEAGSFSLFMLGALLGILNLGFIIFRNERNVQKINQALEAMTQINAMILLFALLMFVLGTYISSLWAVEARGNFWEWEERWKWGGITILGYLLIVIGWLRSQYINAYFFNTVAVIGGALTIMTDFGSNYCVLTTNTRVDQLLFFSIGIIGLTIIIGATWWNRRYNQSQRI